MRAAFYAPLKSPQHPSPSGDRTMARLLLRALARAGAEPALASGLRTLDLAGDPARQAALRDASAREADRLLALYEAEPGRRPDLWFTYHVYYKAPDWLGPRVSEALGIPYLVAEASRAGKRAGGPWALGHEAAEAAIRRADRIFVLTDADREALARDGDPRRLVSLPPFLDLDGWDLGDPPRREPAGPRSPLRLLAVGMMRRGDKLASYRLLADALARLEGPEWTLDVAGDGDVRAQVEALLGPFGARVRLHGALRDRAALSALYRSCHLLVWPAVNEAYGMALLEAQAHGLPVAAGAYGGVAAVVRHGETGLLAAPGDPAALAEAVRALAGGLDAYGTAAARFVREERGLDRAAAILRAALAGLVREGAP